MKDLFHKGDYLVKFDIQKGITTCQISCPFLDNLQSSSIFCIHCFCFLAFPSIFCFHQSGKRSDETLDVFRNKNIWFLNIDGVFGGARMLNEAQKVSNLVRQYLANSCFSENAETSLSKRPTFFGIHC